MVEIRVRREGGSHLLWVNPANGSVETVPRHTEIPYRLGIKICKGLGITNFHKENEKNYR